MNKILKTIIAYLILIVLPIALSIPFNIGFGNKRITEIVMAFTGLIYFLILVIRYWLKDRKLFKNRISNSDFKKTDDYTKYININIILLISGIALLSLSYIYFVIFIK